MIISITATALYTQKGQSARGINKERRNPHDVKMHLLMAYTINLLMRWFVSSKSDRLLSSKRQRAIAIKISDKIASTPNGSTEEIYIKKSKGPLRVNFQMEGLTETSFSRANSLLIKLQRRWIQYCSWGRHYSQVCNSFCMEDSWDRYQSKISDWVHPFQSLEQRNQFH